MKGINPFERHVEKFVFGAFALFVLGVLVMQTGLVGGSRTIKVGSAELPIDGALVGVKEIALQRQTRLQSDQIAQGVPASLPDPTEVFEASKSAAAAPIALASLGSSALRAETTGAQPAGLELPKNGDARFAAIKLPTPATPLTNIFEGTIDPITVAELGAPLASLLPPHQPFDARVISVETTFDASALRKSIEEPEGEGFVALPTSIWHGRVEIVDVEWVRQQQNAEGAWGDEAVLGSLPGRASLRPTATKEDFQPADYKDLLDQERALRQEIRRPEFYPSITGRSWIWPSQVRKEIEMKEAPEIVGLKRELAEVRRQLENSRRALDRLNNKGAPKKEKDGKDDRGGGAPPNKPPTKGPPGGGGGGGGGGDRGPSAEGRAPSDPLSGFPEEFDHVQWPEIPTHWLAQGLGGGGGGGGDNDKPQGPSTEEKRKEREAQAKKRLEDEIAKLEKREREILDELAQKGVADKGDLIQTQFAEPVASLASTELEKATLWTHDLTAKPGGTYRYKARVRVTNPYYGQADGLHKDQQALANDPILVSEASDWSEPARIEPDTVYFVTSASEPGGPLASSSRAGAEIYHFFYGYWRKLAVPMTPGDALAGTIDLPADWTTFELERDAGQRWTIKERPPIEKKMPLSTGIFLLDTAAAIGGKGGVVQAYLRDASGAVTVRRPTDEGSDADRRQHLQSSASLASSALVREPGSIESPSLPGGGTQPPPGKDDELPPIGGGSSKPGKEPSGSPPGPKRERN